MVLSRYECGISRAPALVAQALDAGDYAGRAGVEHQADECVTRRVGPQGGALRDPNAPGCRSNLLSNYFYRVVTTR